MTRALTVLATGLLALAGCSGPDDASAPTLQTLTIVGAGTGAGTVTSNPLGINCGATCTASFVGGTQVTLTAVATPGSIFNGWTGGGCTGVSPCVVTITPGLTVTATFQAQSFTIAGTATTVVGSGCVLQLNGANNLGITGNGLFTFSTPLLHGTAYTTTILSQPTGPAQTCTLTNATGTVSAANVTNIGLSCAVDRPACAAATDLGSISGDAGAATVSRGAAGERWFRIRLTEDDSNVGGVYLSASFTLTVPAGVDYDLFVHCAACGGSPAASSTAGTGQVDQAFVRWDDDFGEDDSGDVFVQVRYVSGASPNNWTLQIVGNVVTGTVNCNF